MVSSRREFLTAAGSLGLAATVSDVAAAGEADAESTATRQFKRIAMEEAFFTTETIDGYQRLADSGYADPAFVQEMALLLNIKHPGLQRILDRLMDLEGERLSIMDANGIDMQVLGLSAPGINVFEKDDAVSIAQRANDQLGAALIAHPDRYIGMATIVAQDPKWSAKELERCVNEYGMKLALSNSHTHDEYLDAKKNWPMFEALESLNLPLYIHPRAVGAKLRESMMGADFNIGHVHWGFGIETSTHAVRLMYSGVFDQFPGLKVILGHMGEGIPFWLNRMDAYTQASSALGLPPGIAKRLPSDYFRENFYVTTSGFYDHAALKLCHDVLGPEKIMFAVDYPYGSTEKAVKMLNTAPFPEDDLQMMFSGNAERLLGLS
ncbi:MAG: amidohydrolase family protein [Pseudomonadota bacterium]